mgnify:FL=1
MVKTMEWQGQSLLLLDQTKLPSEIITILCKDYRRVGEAIKRLEVRGAPAIGAAAAFGMVLGWQELASRYADFSQETLLIEFKKIKNFCFLLARQQLILVGTVEKII